MARPSARILVPGLIAAAATLAGCGASAPSHPSHTLRVGVTEYRIHPSTLIAATGQITVEVTNFGRLTHDLSVLKGSTAVASTPDIPPGATRSLHVTLSAGTYTIDSNITDDQALGMLGTLDVIRPRS